MRLFFWEGVKAKVCRGCRGKQLESVHSGRWTETFIRSRLA